MCARTACARGLYHTPCPCFSVLVPRYTHTHICLIYALPCTYLICELMYLHICYNMYLSGYIWKGLKKGHSKWMIWKICVWVSNDFGPPWSSPVILLLSELIDVHLILRFLHLSITDLLDWKFLCVCVCAHSCSLHHGYLSGAPAPTHEVSLGHMP